MVKPQRTASVTFIFVTILLDAIGLGVLIPVLPDVLRRFSTDPTTVSNYFGLFIGAYALMQFVASPVLGALSDRFGRKPILLNSLLCSAIDYMFMAFAPNMPLLFVGRLISGLTGASMTVAASYMADISTAKTRSANFGMIGAGWGIGFIAGPMLGGLLSSLGPIAPFIAAASLNFVNFVFGVFVLPESLPLDQRRNVDLKHINPFRSIIKVLKPSDFQVLVWIYFLVFLASQVHPVNWTLYNQTKFGWTAWQVGLSLSFVGVIIAFSQGYLTRLIIPKIGEEKSLTLGLFVAATAYTLFGLASHSWMMYAIMVYFGLSGLTMPSLQSIIGRYIPANRQGEMQGSLVSLGSLAAVIAPLMFTRLFVSFTKNPQRLYFPGAAYVGAGLISLVGLLVWKSSQKRAKIDPSANSNRPESIPQESRG